MDPLLVAMISALASFVGSWAAFKVHMHYLRRDVDEVKKRLDDHEKLPHERRDCPRRGLGFEL